MGTAAVGYRTESMHGAGSPQAQRIMIARQGNLEMKKLLAENAQLRRENEILTTAAAFFAARLDPTRR